MASLKRYFDYILEQARYVPAQLATVVSVAPEKQECDVNLAAEVSIHLDILSDKLKAEGGYADVRTKEEKPAPNIATASLSALIKYQEDKPQKHYFLPIPKLGSKVLVMRYMGDHHHVAMISEIETVHMIAKAPIDISVLDGENIKTGLGEQLQNLCVIVNTLINKMDNLSGYSAQGPVTIHASDLAPATSPTDQLIKGQLTAELNDVKAIVDDLAKILVSPKVPTLQTPRLPDDDSDTNYSPTDNTQTPPNQQNEDEEDSNSTQPVDPFPYKPHNPLVANQMMGAQDPNNLLQVQQSASWGNKIGGTYGYTRTYPSGNPKWHGGLDISAPVGTPVYTLYDDGVITFNPEDTYVPAVIRNGKVIKAASGSECGKKITMVYKLPQRTRLTVVYCHLDSICGPNSCSFNQDDTIPKKGYKIGEVGATGNASQARSHLHVTMYLNGRNIDPNHVLRMHQGWDKYEADYFKKLGTGSNRRRGSKEYVSVDGWK